MATPLVVATGGTPEDVFRTMCEQHDLTHSFSDDYSVERRGAAEYKELLTFAKANLPYPDARTIWNDVVLQKTKSREMFMWKEGKDWSEAGWQLSWL